MKAAALFRIAAVLLILFAAGPTFGCLSFKAPSPEARPVFECVKNVHFQAMGTTFSYGVFYRGFGLDITVYLMFSAFLAWQLGAMALRSPGQVSTLGWALCAVQIISPVLSWMYFSMVPAAFQQSQGYVWVGPCGCDRNCVEIW